MTSLTGSVTMPADSSTTAKGETSGGGVTGSQLETASQQRANKRKKVLQERRARKQRRNQAKRSKGRSRTRSRSRSHHRDDSASECDSDLDLRKELKPIGCYVHHREDMLEHLFRSISNKKLRAMLPECCKSLSLDELKALCLEELDVMSRKRILRILDGADPDVISSTDSDEDSSDPDQLEAEEEEEVEGEEGEAVEPELEEEGDHHSGSGSVAEDSLHSDVSDQQDESQSQHIDSTFPQDDHSSEYSASEAASPQSFYSDHDGSVSPAEEEEMKEGEEKEDAPADSPSENQEAEDGQEEKELEEEEEDMEVEEEEEAEDKGDSEEEKVLDEEAEEGEVDDDRDFNMEEEEGELPEETREGRIEEEEPGEEEEEGEEEEGEVIEEGELEDEEEGIADDDNPEQEKEPSEASDTLQLDVSQADIEGLCATGPTSPEEGEVVNDPAEAEPKPEPDPEPEPECAPPSKRTHKRRRRGTAQHKTEDYSSPSRKTAKETLKESNGKQKLETGKGERKPTKASETREKQESQEKKDDTRAFSKAGNPQKPSCKVSSSSTKGINSPDTEESSDTKDKTSMKDTPSEQPSAKSRKRLKRAGITQPTKPVPVQHEETGPSVTTIQSTEAKPAKIRIKRSETAQVSKDPVKQVIAANAAVTQAKSRLPASKPMEQRPVDSHQVKTTVKASQAIPKPAATAGSDRVELARPQRSEPLAKPAIRPSDAKSQAGKPMAEPQVKKTAGPLKRQVVAPASSMPKAAATHPPAKAKEPQISTTRVVVCETPHETTPDPPPHRKIQLKAASSSTSEATASAVLDPPSSSTTRTVVKKQRTRTIIRRPLSAGTTPSTAKVSPAEAHFKQASLPTASTSSAEGAPHRKVIKSKASSPGSQGESSATGSNTAVETKEQPSEEESMLSQNQMEILELEMRARAIKAMLKAANPKAPPKK